MERMSFSYFILGLCLFQVLPFITAKTYKCKKASQDIVEPYGIKEIIEANQVLTYEYKDYFIEPSSRDYTTFVLDNVKVNFEGHLLAKGAKSSNLIKKTFDTNRVVVHHKFAKSKKQCRVHEADFLKKKFTGQPKLAAIHALTKACLEEFVCGEWEKFTSHDFLVKQKLEATLLEISNKKPKNNKVSPTKAVADGHYDTKSTWNALFDVGKSIAIDQLIGNTEGLLVLPETKFDFDQLGISGQINLKSIIIKGLKSLERIKDLSAHRYKHRYELSTGLQLTNLNIKIPKYEGKYGSIKINGAIEANIPKVAVSFKAAIDYNSRPCKIEVEELKKDNLEEPKVEFTGLGALNWPVQKVTEYFIRNNLFDTVRDVVAEQIKGLECEKFRSSFESVKF